MEWIDNPEFQQRGFRYTLPINVVTGVKVNMAVACIRPAIRIHIKLELHWSRCFQLCILRVVISRVISPEHEVVLFSSCKFATAKQYSTYDCYTTACKG